MTRRVLVALALVGGCGAAQHPGGVACAGSHVLSAQAAVIALASCRTVGSLTIRGAGVTDLSPLAALETIDGDLTIGPTFALDEVRLDGLRAVGGRLRLVSNAVATGAYLPALERAGAVEIASNVALLGASLPALRVVGADLVVEDDPALATLLVGQLQRVDGAVRLADVGALVVVDLGAVKAPDPQ